jgi:predicted alpha/beta hydrolase family esterase
MAGRDCIIIHGCPSGPEGELDASARSYDKHWIPWVRASLIERGIPTIVPLMPTPWAPDYEKYREEFERYPVSEGTILIGHSCGCAFLVRWLGNTKQKVHTLVLVAPWKIPRAGDMGRKAFYDYPIDRAIKTRVRHIIMFTSDTEHDDGRKSLEIYHAALGGEIRSIPNKGHYIDAHMGTQEFPELLDAIV